jgi:tight adherence protein B
MTAPAAGGLLGAGAGLGAVLVICGLRGRPWPGARWRLLAARLHADASISRAAGTLLAVIVMAASTRWPAGTVLAGAAAWFLPPMLGPDNRQARAVERIEAVASWTESLRDTLAAAAGLEQAILAIAPASPPPVREPVVALAARIRGGQPLAAALRALAEDIADPAADLVAAALILAAEQQARDLGRLLSSLATSARQQAAMRRRIVAGRARVRTAARIIIAVTLVFTVGLLAFSRAFLSPYGTAAGQIMLVLVGACFAAAFWWLGKISRTDQDARMLTGLDALSSATHPEAKP